MDEQGTLGYWIRRRRKALDLTQEALAQHVGCATVTVRKIESDERRPSQEIAERLADALALTPEERSAFLAVARGEHWACELALVRRPIATVPGGCPPTNLPVLREHLIGRDDEVAAVRALLLRDNVGLLTLTGPGGTGKTRLAFQVAADGLNDFGHGAWLVDLAPIRDPALVLTTIAQTLGVKAIGGQPLLEVLKAYLRDRCLLLVLDNFEQILTAASLVMDLLSAAPNLKVLVTSRTVLHLSGEREYPVPPLALPDLRQPLALERLTQYAAVALFIQRVQASKPDFHVTDDTAPAVAEICVRLDGLPLALELAAARIKLLSPQDLLLRLHRRLVVLTGGARDLPLRQQTLRATIAWSFSLLTPAEQRLFWRLGVFVGGWTLAAAEAICNAEDDPEVDVLDGLQALLDQSLLRQTERQAGSPRFTMLETIREYALEQLEASGEADTLRQHHAAYFLALAERAAPEVIGTHQLAWLDRLELEHDNLRAVLAWSRTAACDGSLSGIGLHLAVALREFWIRRGGHMSEARRWLEDLLAHVEAGSIPALPPSLRGWALRDLGFLAMMQGDQTGGATLLTASLRLFQALDEPQGMAAALHELGGCALVADDVTGAVPLLEESLALSRALGNGWCMAWSLAFLAEAVYGQNDHDRVLALLEESLASFRDTGDSYGIAYALTLLGSVAQEQGDEWRARVLLAESFALLAGMGTNFAVALTFLELARLAAAQVRQRSDAEHATRLYGVADVVHTTLGIQRMDSISHTGHQRPLAFLRIHLDEVTFAAAWAEGRAMTLEQAVAYALEETKSE